MVNINKTIMPKTPFTSIHIDFMNYASKLCIFDKINSEVLNTFRSGAIIVANLHNNNYKMETPFLIGVFTILNILEK